MGPSDFPPTACADADRALEALLAEPRAPGDRTFAEQLAYWHARIAADNADNAARARWLCSWKQREIETFRPAFEARTSDVPTLLAAAHYAAEAPAIHAEAAALDDMLSAAAERREAREGDDPRSALARREQDERAYWTRYFTVFLTWQHALDGSAPRDRAVPFSSLTEPFVAARMSLFYAAAMRDHSCTSSVDT